MCVFSLIFNNLNCKLKKGSETKTSYHVTCY